MLWVSVPWELTPGCLLELQDVPSPLHDKFARATELLRRGELVPALTVVDQLSTITTSQRDRYVGALALIVRADVLRRMALWEESLNAVRRALHWLELKASPIAYYNEGIAVYLKGIVHYALRTEEKVVAAFDHAQEVLSDSERHWEFQNDAARAAKCRDILLWTRRLLELQVDVDFGDAAMVMPVYELVNRTVIRTDAALIRQPQIVIPNDVLTKYASPEIQPLQLDAVSVLHPDPQVQYAAIRIRGDKLGGGFGRKGDLLIVEITGNNSTADESGMTSDTPFIRRGNGRIEFRATTHWSTLEVNYAGSGLIGIPRILIREGEAK